MHLFLFSIRKKEEEKKKKKKKKKKKFEWVGWSDENKYIYIYFWGFLLGVFLKGGGGFPRKGEEKREERRGEGERGKGRRRKKRREKKGKEKKSVQINPSLLTNHLYQKTIESVLNLPEQKESNSNKKPLTCINTDEKKTT